MSTALVLTVSIMLQNLPEGMVVSTALRAEGSSAKKSFFYGMLSGVTAPMGAVPGALAAGVTAGILPVALAFAAGAMIYVVFEEVIPEANASGNGNAVNLMLFNNKTLEQLTSYKSLGSMSDKLNMYGVSAVAYYPE